MPKCKNCGKQGLFLTLKDGLCNKCYNQSIYDQQKAAINELKNKNDQQNQEINELRDKLNILGAEEYFEVQKKVIALNQALEDGEKEIQSLKDAQLKENETILSLNREIEKLEKKLSAVHNKIHKSKTLYDSVAYAIDHFFNENASEHSLKLSAMDLSEIEELSPSVTLKLHCMDMRELRKAYKDNDKNINKVLEQYSKRYTTKANKAIYNLMVIALRAELQNILYNLKFEKLDSALNDVKNVTEKYLSIAGEGNQQILGTLTKFIGEIEYLFTNAVKIEYNYYIKKEQARQEQLAIREQMRQEAEERKALEAEKKKIENEESKYISEIEKLSNQLSTAKDAENEALKAKILELQSQLSEVIIKKEEISNLQNGKAGNVYIISNLGSFGDSVFKVGMTRRLNPQDRVNELGDASVPFKFDVHSFIFSDDAVSLEKRLHSELNHRRVNKVNLRKEFFNITIDELEQLVNEIEPTAEFNKTMLAEEYKQSLSCDENYISDESIVFDYDDLE